jgi:hypothetical protein
VPVGSTRGRGVPSQTGSVRGRGGIVRGTTRGTTRGTVRGRGSLVK